MVGPEVGIDLLPEQPTGGICVVAFDFDWPFARLRSEKPVAAARDWYSWMVQGSSSFPAQACCYRTPPTRGGHPSVPEIRRLCRLRSLAFTVRHKNFYTRGSQHFSEVGFWI